MAKYFTFKEMVHTDTGLDNMPNWEQIRNLERLVEFMDTIRSEFGKPIRVNCAFRSKAVNDRVGGSSTSQHLQGLACDICAYSGKESDNRALLGIIEKSINGIDQIISYHKRAGDPNTMIRFIHVGLSPSYNPRRQRLYK